MFFVRNLGQVKRSVSPIISVILLIVIAVIIVTLILNWGTAFTTKQIAKVDEFQEYKSIEGFITINKTIDGNIWLYNNHNEKDVVITGYKIRTDADELEGYSFLNTKIDLDYSINFNHKSEVNLGIACFPSNDFYLDLYTDEQKYIPLKVKINSIVNPNSCLNYGLVGHWDFKDIGSLTLSDKSGNGNDGTIHNTTINDFWAQGNGKGVFDGIDDYVDLGTSFNSTFSSDFSISMWVYIYDGKPTSAGMFFGLVDIGDAYVFQYYLNPDGSLMCNYTNNNSSASRPLDTISPVFSDGLVGWKHFVITFKENSIAKLYVDVIVEDTALIEGRSFTGFSAINNLFVGARNIYDAGNGTHFNGLISDIKMYDRALSSQEVEDLYDLSKGRYQ